MENKLKRKDFSNIPKWFLFADIIFMILFVIRSAFAVCMLDEPFNIGESFRTVLGVSFLTENWDFFQTGDSFLYPFLKIFYSVTGSAEGIILFSRAIFLIAVFAFSFFTYRILKKCFDSLTALTTVSVFALAIALKMYSLYYDSCAQYFQALGFILLFYYFQTNQTVSKSNKLWILFTAGICHSFMVYSYPTTIIVVIYSAIYLLAFNEGNNSKRWKRITAYGAGLFIVFAFFMILVFTKGIQNLFIFNTQATSTGLSGRQYIFTVQGIYDSLRNMIIANFVLYRKALILSLLSLISAVLFRKKTWTVFLVALFSIIGSIVFVCDYGIKMTDVGNHLMFYLSSYSIPLFIIYGNNNDKVKTALNLFFTVQLPSYICGVAYACTALYGSYKLSQGAKFSVIVTLILFSEIIKDKCSSLKKAQNFIGILSSVFIIFNMCILLSSTYFGTDPIKCNQLITSGPFKGIIDSQSVCEEIQDFENGLFSVIKDSDKSITFGEGVIFGYFETDLIPNTNYLWGPGIRDGIVVGKSPEILKKYYNTYYGYADIIVIRDKEVETRSPAFMDFLQNEYKLVLQKNNYYYYRHQ